MRRPGFLSVFLLVMSGDAMNAVLGFLVWFGLLERDTHRFLFWSVAVDSILPLDVEAGRSILRLMLMNIF